MISTDNINLGIISLQNLIEFFGYSNTREGDLMKMGMGKVVDIYRYMSSIYLDSLQTMETQESNRILNELETVNNKIMDLVDAINNDEDDALVENLRLERNKLMMAKTKLLNLELTKLDTQEAMDANNE
ncbi:BlyB family putative holin accessory protein [Candidatus Borreliella tachyglossi]|uniref:BlyB family putative holin accessory protein n=1 Tax=Candidatus Borreliella tachyglossi TaxID=1964448 RepID=UPI004042C731